MLTQRVDAEHDILGFTVDWIESLATQVEYLDVLTGYEGTHDLPENVAVHSYGKERGFSKPRRVAEFERHVATSVFGDTDVVFVHMIPNYVIAAWPWLALSGTPCVMWYAHQNVDLKLRVAHSLADAVVTPTESSFRISSGKVRVAGHGIDTDRFSPGPPPTERELLLGVGRIDPIKNFETLIEAVRILSDDGRDVTLRIVGEPAREESYLDTLREYAEELGVNDRITFTGAIPHEEIVEEYRRAGLFLNASQTGSLDKTEIEAMACGTPVISSNDSYAEMVRDVDLDASVLTFQSGDAQDLAEQVEHILDMDPASYERLGHRCRSAARARHDVDALMGNLSKILAEHLDKA